MSEDTTAVKPSSKAAWKKNRDHNITLPSGTVVTVRVPNLTAMAKAGTLPNELLELVAADQKDAPTLSVDEQIKQQYQFNKSLVTLAVVAPEITEADYDDIPAEDTQMIIQIALRQTDLDAIGHQLGGLEKVPEFRDFRDLDRSFADILGQ